MNDNHDFCDTETWRTMVREQIIPWALGDGGLGDDVLEVGPGFGATTEVFCEQVAALTALEIDPVLAARLSTRFDGSNVTVVKGTAAAMPFEDGRFSGATCFSMLHHVPTDELQDRVFAEVARVLRPGALFVATDSLDSPDLRHFHDGDTYVPVDPSGLPERLTSAGFVGVEVQTNRYGWAATARTAAAQ